MLKVERFPTKGRGIIATQFISKGTAIETAPADAFPPTHRELLDQTEVSKYCFVKPSEYNEENKEVNGYLVFGLSSLCNHSEQPNAKIEWRKDQIGLWAKLVALQNIQPTEEITIHYTNIDEYPVETFV